ncbi:hypothetical protein [Paenibacillus paeoniae]|uniref:Uncharacterized protein n=1 Tax=Paenibacillus paeoniae TaxID=2292705 RepID=A0A371P7D0_9BACL|nr:hypothetical protein [Paenibacillus paeoniae]REK71853.1 hypothetical protein DX130_19270 [Paenibacillus paeoniae]
MGKEKDELVIMLRKGQQHYVSKTPLKGVDRVVFVYNGQFTNAPNTTQIANGAGRSGTAGNNGAINSPDAFQQQSVGAGGIAKNKGLKKGSKHKNKTASRKHHQDKEVIIVINEQVVELSSGQELASATQVAGGAGGFSAAGTNSAIDSPRTKQQHAVGGGSGSLGENELISKRKKK